VEFRENYDNTAKEPTVLPAQFPNLLVNGAGGIAVGMATNIPPHNLGEVIDACLALLDHPEMTIDELMELVPGPDFPTGGIILGKSGIRSAYHNGRGSVIMRGRTHIEEAGRDREAIIITEVPYQVNKARMLEQIADAVRDKRIEGIAGLRDESDRDGVRVVVTLRRDAMHEVVLNQLYRFSPLQSSFGVNMLALDAGQPSMMNLKDILSAFIDFRYDVITRRTIFDLNKARERAHILVGLAIAVANLDAVIAMIRGARDPAIARAKLMENPWLAVDVEPLVALIDEPGREVVDGVYSLSDAQARAILELRLHRLTGLERGKIADDLTGVCAEIGDYLEILGSKERLRAIFKGELGGIKDAFATPRRTDLQESEVEYDIENLIQREDMVVTVSHKGYIKRVPLSTYRAQRRGGKGRAGMSTREEDFVDQVFVVNTHTPVLFFSSRGIVYKQKVYRLPMGNPQSRGKALVNLLPLQDGETISTLLPLPEDEESWAEFDVMFSTTRGSVRRNKLSDFANVMTNGKIAMKLGEGDSLVGVKTCTEQNDILLATHMGKCIRFPVKDVRVFQGRNSTGNRGIRLMEGDEVISMSILGHADFATEERDAYLRIAAAKRRGNGEVDNDGGALSEERAGELEGGEQFILTIADSGYGKRSSAYQYRITRRGGKGIELMSLGHGENHVVAAFPVTGGDQIMLVTNGGKLIRCPVEGIRIAGRSTRGVTLFRVGEGERVVSVARLIDVGDDGDDGNGGDNGNGGDADDADADEADRELEAEGMDPGAEAAKGDGRDDG
ncbi:MAG: DNA gyrase subunit A, partial [Alphaproteobacteria bacterium]